MLELKGLEIDAGESNAATVVQLRGRLAPNGTQEEITLKASYRMADGSIRPVRVVGHPSFSIGNFDPIYEEGSELPWLSRKLSEMVDFLDAKIPDMPIEQREDFIRLYRSHCTFAYRVNDDREFASRQRISEADFQKELKKFLQADPSVGLRLQEKTRVAGGFVDLMLGSVVSELKVEHDCPVTLGDAHRYMSQPTHYSSARGCPISILCILDDSPKSLPPGELSNYMGWIRPATHGLDDPVLPSMVAVVIVPVGFGEPHRGAKSKT
jgi:hypothetical protein